MDWLFLALMAALVVAGVIIRRKVRNRKTRSDGGFKAACSRGSPGF